MLEAMKLGLEYLRADSEEPAVNYFENFLLISRLSFFFQTLNVLSPNEIKQLLYYILSTNNSQQTTQPNVEVEQR